MRQGEMADRTGRFRQILGVRFFVGNACEAIEEIVRTGGMVVVPAAPALKNLATDEWYRQALLSANFAIADSAFMVLLWNLLQRDYIPKLSGLKYLRALIERPDFCEPGASFWVMPTPKAVSCNLGWLRSKGVPVEHRDVYKAPFYGPTVVEDSDLLLKLEQRRPAHVVLALGGGTQEKLGAFLKANLTFNPAIHCIGAAIAFLSGDQVHIPAWADSMGLGWLFRCAFDPKRFGPRYWDARHLAPLMLRYRDRLPIKC